MDKNKKLKRNLIIGLGTLTAIATPIVVVVSKELGKNSHVSTSGRVNNSEVPKSKSSKKHSPSKIPQKSEPVKSEPVKVTLQSKLEGLINMIPGIDSGLKSNIIPIAKDFLLNGIKSVKEKDLDNLLTNLGLSKDITKIIHNFLIKDGKVDDTLIDMLLNKGFSGLVDNKNSEYFDALLTKVINLLPSSVTREIPKDFIKKIFKGMTQKDFNHFINSKVHLNVLFSSLAGTLYGEMPILKKGIILASGQDWKDTITGIIGDWKNFGKFIKGSLPKKAEKQEQWQLSKIVTWVFTYLSRLNNKTGHHKISMLDSLTEGIGNFFHSGLNSVKPSQIKEFINLFNWGKNYHQGDIFESDKKKLKADLKKIIKDSNLKDKKRNPVDLSPIDKATKYSDIIDAAKDIRGYTKEVVGKIGDVVKGLTSKKVYENLGDWYITKNDIFGKHVYSSSLKSGISLLFENAVKRKKALTNLGRDIDIDRILKSSYKDIKRLSNNPWELWPYFDKLINKIRNIPTYDRWGRKTHIDFNGYLKETRAWSKMIEKVKEQLAGYFGSSDLTKNDKLNLVPFDNIFTIKGVLDQIDKFVKGKTLYKNKVITIPPKEINISWKINDYLKAHVNNFHFHINSLDTINNYGASTVKVLKQLKTKKTKNGKVVTSLLDLTSLSTKESIQDIHNQAVAIIKANISKGLFKENDKVSLTLDQAEKLLPIIPNKEYGFALTQEFLGKPIKSDFTLTTIYNALVNSRLLSKFILEGMPETKTKWEELKKSLAIFVKPILKEKGLNIPIEFFMPILDPVFEQVQKERKAIQESKNKQIPKSKQVSKNKQVIKSKTTSEAK